MTTGSFNSNILALKSNRLLSQASDSVSQAFERLSTGMRINRAADDAAGMAIADTLRANARTSNMAVRNSNDAISLLSLASSALDSQRGILVRLAELAEQSANGTFSNQQRSALSSEYKELLAESDRIASTTKFNNQTPLFSRDGLKELAFQVGINGDALSVLKIDTADTGFMSGAISLSTINQLNPSFMSESFEELSSETQGILGQHTFVDGASEIPTYFTFAGPPIIAGETAQVTAVFYVDNGSGFENGGQVQLLVDISTGEVATPDSFDIVVPGEGFFTVNFDLDLSALRIFNENTVGFSASSQNSALHLTGVENIARATTALDFIKGRQSELAGITSQFGAAQSRLQSVISVTSSSAENLVAAKARITDIDVAEESAQLVAGQILQQSAAAILAQANQQPAVLLSLLE